MKKYLFGFFALILTISLFSCSTESTGDEEIKRIGDAHINQPISFSDGVEFNVLKYETTKSIGIYTTENKYLVITVSVCNRSSENFSSEATDVCLMIDDTKVMQQKIVSRFDNGYDNISQAPTTKKEYRMCFEIGNDVSINTLNLVLNNGSAFSDKETISIALNQKQVFLYKDLYFTENDDGTVTIIGSKYNLEKIEIPNSIKEKNVISIEEKAFQNNSTLKEVNICSNGIEEISINAFQNCENLKKISLPQNLKKIGYGAFFDCINLSEIIIPDSVTIIEGSAFWGCTALNNIIIGKSVKRIEHQTFINCSSLESISIPPSVEYVDNNAFLGCTGLTNICVENGNNNYHSENNCLIETQTNTVLLGCKNSTIPNYVTKIGHYAFDEANLTNIVLPNGLTDIGYAAFSDCNIRELILPKSVIHIGFAAFANQSITVYYEGTADDWYNITFDDQNGSKNDFQYSTRYYYSENEPIWGDHYNTSYWHYGSDGKILIWEKP